MLLSLDSSFRWNDISRGYTLLELLLALLIYSFVAVLVTSSLSSVLSTREKTHSHELRLAEIQLAMSLLERDIEQIINRPIINVLGRLEPALLEDASNQRIEFTRMGYINPLAAYPRSTLSRVGYQFKKNSLVRLAWANVDRTKDIEPSERIILSQVEKIQWIFYDAENKPYSLWPPAAFWLFNLPSAIQLTLVLKDKGQINRLFVLPESNNVSASK